MNESELVRAINTINKSVEKAFENEILAIVEKNLPQNDQIQPITSQSDLKGFSVAGFYMIFNNDPNAPKHCTCSFSKNNKTYTCVYRGQANPMKERVESHLFYSPTGRYDNCMLVTHNGNEYNVDISKSIFYTKGKKTGIGFPRYEWFVVKISLPNSKQETREMFEHVFDRKYGKPIYSHK